MLNPGDIPERFPITEGDHATWDNGDTHIHPQLMVPVGFDSCHHDETMWRPARFGCGKGLGATLNISQAIDCLASACEQLGSEPSMENIQGLAWSIADGHYMNRRYIPKKEWDR